MKNLVRISPNLILVLLIWKVSRLQSSVFSKNMPLLKQISLCANEAPFMANELHKAIMKRTKLRNKFLKSKKTFLTGKDIHGNAIFAKSY